ncbi:MAG: MopE-related protein, partial [Myxococcota bacterium]|nr:MopE-related protein [Myxococcota bacterium]
MTVLPQDQNTLSDQRSAADRESAGDASIDRGDEREWGGSPLDAEVDQAGSCRPSEERCDARDNDCDGLVDEGFDIGAICEALGICGAGRLECNDAGGLRCSSAPGGHDSPASDERCGGLDEDCDGIIDEGLRGGEVCEAEGVCGRGFIECVAMALPRCNVAPGGSASPAEAERCDGLDGDCDGRIDEEVATLPCFDGPPGREGVGRCLGGLRSCVDGRYSACEGAQLPAPADQSCDGIDDDCDGQVDEDYLPVRCGEGACRTGARPSRCEGGVERLCEPAEPLDEDQNCDGIDGDCDGLIDNHYTPLSCGLGQCRAEAQLSRCELGGVEIACIEGEAAAQDARCDGFDEDCDGRIDEDFSPTLSCGIGSCRARSTPGACAGGVERACVPADPLGPLDESCNGVDDDCDQRFDEDYVPVLSCGLGRCGVESTPSRCVSGQERACRPGPAEALDLRCDGVDEDCDGPVDEDYRPTESCGIGRCRLESQPSLCADGVEQGCIEGVARQTDGLCSGLDDDCDGRFDEDAPLLAAAPRLLSEGESPASAPQIAYSGDRALALYLQSPAAGQVALFTQRLITEGPLGPRHQLSQLPGVHSEAKLAATNEGWSVVWVQSQSGRRQLRAALLSREGEVTVAPLQLSQNADAPRGPALVIDEVGHPWVAWTDQRHGGSSIYLQRLLDDLSPAAPELRVSGIGEVASAPTLAARPGGIWLSYRRQQGNSYQLQIVPLDLNGELAGDARILSDPATAAAGAQLIGTSEGGFAATWYDIV